VPAADVVQLDDATLRGRELALEAGEVRAALPA